VTSKAEETSANGNLLDRAIYHAILAERFKNHEVRRIVRILDREVLPDLVERLASRLQNIATRGFDTGPTTTARLRHLFRDLRDVFLALVERMNVETEGPLLAYAAAQSGALARDLRRESGALVSVTTPSAGTLRQAVMRRPFDGFLLKERWEKRGRAFRESVEAQVRIGLVQSETPEQIIQRVREVWPAQRRHVGATVRAGVSHAQNQARQATYEENRRLIRGIMWVSTLDISTCPRCGSLDGQVFEVDDGPRPPEHFNCRCTTAPVMRAADDLGGSRASMDGQVPESVTFSEWIERQSVERQDLVFGRGRARLFRSGKLELEQMVDAAGNVIPLADLLSAIQE
jgi:SPP1 gp7 family putative phage head morphogenesis protein